MRTVSRCVMLETGLLASIACSANSGSSSFELCNLLPGELVINEIFADPEGDDNGKEWLEIYNASERSQSLYRVIVGVESGDSSKSYSLSGVPDISAKGYKVLGDGPVSDIVDISYGKNLGALNNVTGGLSLSCRGTVIDTVRYGEGGTASSPQSGQSLMWDGGQWCEGVDLYDDVNRGTPGVENTPCGLTTCFDHGVARESHAPSVGEIMVTEVLASAAGTDHDQEWVEVYVSSSATRDLNGLTIRNTSVSLVTKTFELNSPDCLMAYPGGYYVIGASTDGLINGGAPVDWEWTHTANELVNSASTMELVFGTTLIDVASLRAPTERVSVSLDATVLNSNGNDLSTDFCDAKSTGHFAGKGTPGLVNDTCGCMDGVTARRLHLPNVGELLVSEVYSDPIGTNADNWEKEWIEIYVVADHDVDLNSLKIENWTTTPPGRVFTLSDLNCLKVAPGTFVVIGASSDPVKNGGVAVDYVWDATSNLLYTTACTLDLRIEGSLMDRASLPDVAEALTQSLNPTLSAPIDNDVAAAFCPGKTVGMFEGKGTPGIANDSCP